MRTKPHTIELLHFLLVASLVGPAVLLAAMGWLTYRGAFADAESEISRTSEVGREHASKVFDSFRLVSDRVQDALESAQLTAPEEMEAERLHGRCRRCGKNQPAGFQLA